MGCGSSIPIISPTLQTQEDYDEIMGRKIPQQMLDLPISCGRRTSLMDGLIRRASHDGAARSRIYSNQTLSRMMSDEVIQDESILHRQEKKINHKFWGGYDDITENILKKPKEFTSQLYKYILEDDINLIRNSFKCHFVFYNLSSEAVDNLTSKMFYCTTLAGDDVFQQGDQASCYFIVNSGQLEVIINEKSIRILNYGDVFGENSLLYDTPRTASIKALTNSSFWALDRTTFRKTIEALNQEEYEENRKFIDQVKMFSFMTSNQKDTIAAALITTKFQPGQLIVNEGDSADSFYVIKSGLVNVQQGSRMLKGMGPNDTFGERSLYMSSIRKASIKSKTEVKCISLGRDNLTKILGNKIQIIIFNNLIRQSFEKSQTLKLLTNIQLEKIAQNSKISNYQAGDLIYLSGQECDKLIIVLEGNMIKVDTNEFYNKGVCFGDTFIRKEQKSIPMTSDYKMLTNGVVAMISFVQLYKSIGGDFESTIVKNENSHEKQIQNIGAKSDASYLNIQDLIYINKLGQGQFGIVYLVKHKLNQNNIYALKSISKSQIIQQNLVPQILQEKQVLQMTNFPFIMGYVKSFKDDKQIYFLIQYIRGLDLFEVIRDIGILKKYDSQFYTATIILALEYLHSKRIVYRDLKPENIIVDYTGSLLLQHNIKGYMHLIDLGTAKPFSRQSNQRTFTIIGTPHYMAPEMLQGKGYSYNVDLWSTGICMYEFICCSLPYGADLEDPFQIYEEIMKKQLDFPRTVKDKTVKKLIEQLLSKQPEARLGGSYASLKANTWFDDFDWDKLFSKQLNPPYIPDQSKMINDEEINKRFKIGKPILDQIQNELESLNNSPTNKLPKDKQWDADF